MFLIRCGNHAQLGGGSAVERLIRTLAYGWVERCNDIDSYGMSFISKISILFYFISTTVYVFMN